MLNDIKKRKRRIEFTLVLLSIPWFLTLILLIVGVVLALSADEDLFYILGAPFAAISSFMASMMVKFKKNSLIFKKAYVTSMINELLPSLMYEPLEGLDIEIVKKSALIRPFDTLKSEDLIYGKIDHLDFKCADIQTFKKIKDSKKQSKQFVGRYFVVKFNERNYQKVFVLPPGYSEATLTDMQKFELEWIKFNNQFNVYANEAHHAFYALTSKFMERLSSINDLYKDLAFAFDKDELHIAFNSKTDSLDLRLFKPINERFFSLIKEEILLVKNIINDLK